MARNLRLTCDAVPVQYEGDIDGHPFYFRARYEHWSFDLVENGMDPLEPGPALRAGKLLIHCCSPYGDGPFAAGYMEHSEAERIINMLMDKYEAGHRGAIDGCSSPMDWTPEEREQHIAKMFKAVFESDPNKDITKMILKGMRETN